MRSALPIAMLAFALLSCGGAPVATSAVGEPVTAKTPAPNTDFGETLRERITGKYRLNNPNAINSVERSAADIRRIVRDQVDASLLVGAVDVTGRDYRFSPADGLRRHVGLLSVRYGDGETARKRILPIITKRFLDGTPVLTPMSATLDDVTVNIVFTETGGDPVLRALISRPAQSVSAPKR